MNLIARSLVVVPSLNGLSDLKRLLSTIASTGARVFVIDSSSDDGTLEYLEEHGFDHIVIPRHEFNHGATRTLAVHERPNYEFYIFMTQDAYLGNADALDLLLQPFSDKEVGAACGRQLAHIGATLFAEHARVFNYPACTYIRSRLDIPSFGLKTAFISNSFSAYRRAALVEVGNFPSKVILSEDMFVAAKMLMAGWKVAYVGDAECMHSHNYSLSEEFRRYFDIGVFHSREHWIQNEFGGASGEGLRYVKSELRFLGFRYIYLWPLALIRNLLKLIAYKLGKNERSLPRWLKRKMSMHRRYWDGPDARNS